MKKGFAFVSEVDQCLVPYLEHKVDFGKRVSAAVPTYLLRLYKKYIYDDAASKAMTVQPSVKIENERVCPVCNKPNRATKKFRSCDKCLRRMHLVCALSGLRCQPCIAKSAMDG